MILEQSVTNQHAAQKAKSPRDLINPVFTSQRAGMKRSCWDTSWTDSYVRSVLIWWMGDTSNPWVHLCVDCMHPLHALKWMAMKTSLPYWCQTEVIFVTFMPRNSPWSNGTPQVVFRQSHNEVLCSRSSSFSMHVASRAEMSSITSTNLGSMEPQIIRTNGPVCCVVMETGQGSSSFRHPSSSKYLCVNGPFHPMTCNLRSLGLVSFLYWLSFHSQSSDEQSGTQVLLVSSAEMQGLSSECWISNFRGIATPN